MALWGYERSPMVEWVRSEVIARHEQLADDLKGGAFFDASALERSLDDLDASRARTLAAVLWAQGLDEARGAELFGLLPALVPASPDKPVVPIPADTPAPRGEPTEKRRQRDKRLALERDIGRLKGELSQAQADRKSRAEQLASTRRELETASADLGAARGRVGELEGEVATATTRARSAETQLREVERQLKQASSANTAYRSDLDRVRSDLNEAEKERRMVTGRLADVQAQLQQRDARLAALPRDTDAIADWLDREETRLRELEFTVEGGTRERVASEKRLRRKLELAFLEAYPGYKQSRPPPPDSTRSLTFRALGGGDEVGRSAYLISIGMHDVLIDCGIAVGARDRDDQVPDLSSLKRLDALLLTHAHTDHIGWAAALVAQLDYFPIYCTQPTAELLPVMLRDSRLHYMRALAQLQLERQYNPGAAHPVEAYDGEDVVDVESRLLEARVGDVSGVGDTDLLATFFPAGHILGAASVLLEGGGRRVVISGDISADHQHTVGPFTVPEGLADVDLLVLESTYGDRSRPPAKEAEEQLVSFVAQTVKQGIALLPCFALGRAQEVLAILTSARRTGRLPGALRILVDGMINKINPSYIEQAKLDAGDFVEIGGQLDRELAIQSATHERAPTVIVTTSGMLNGGPVIEWARRLLPDPRHRMALLGYQDEGAPGGLLKKLAAGLPPYSVRLYGEAAEAFDVTVAAPVTSIGLSAHADQDGLIRYAAAVRPRRIVLVHGDDQARSALRERLVREGICPNVELAQVVSVP
jgi:Cft2 family RNA processing exonuclease/predicted  nucleic acid-binding Zn-ribbon protein